MTQASDPHRNDDVESKGESAGRAWWWWLALFLAIVLTIAFFVGLGNSNDVDEGTSSAELSTATVSRQDLIVAETVSGTLGYGDADAIAFRSAPGDVDTVYGALAGVVTSAPPEGAVVVAGDVLYEVNAAPVVVLYGETPVYRSLDRRTSDGADVMSLEQALVDLGYDPDGDIDIDEDFTLATANAIERLQEDIGATVDGGFALGEMMFAQGPTYVAEALVADGDQVQAGQPVIALSAAPAGTFTAVAPEGEIIDQGGVLYRTDNRPTVLLFGHLPIYRTMAVGDEGTDVAQLQAALTALGIAADDLVIGTFDDATLEAVVAWQVAIGAHPDGVVDLGEVIFLPESIRVGEAIATAGDLAINGSPVLMTSASSTFVTVELSTADQDLVAVGDAVTVELPDGTVVDATVTLIGTVAQASQAGESFFEMIVTIDDPDLVVGLNEAPVDVAIVSDSAHGVIAVPVTALVALSEGGYAVEVVEVDGTRLVGVETGLFADGLVEVTAGDLSSGATVVVP